MKHKILKWIILAVLGIIAFVIVPITYSKYVSTENDTITLNIRKPVYYIKYYNDDTLIDTQEFVYGTAQNIENNTLTIPNKIFSAWNTENDGSGIEYIEGQEVINLASTDGTEINLYAQWADGVARIGTTYYNTLQAAINNVPKTGVETVVELLANVTEKLSVSNGKNIKLDLKNHTVSASSGTLLENSGIVSISNGILDSSSTNAGTINNKSSGTLNISGGQVIMSNPRGKQAIYNEGGNVNISGSALIKTESDPDFARGNVRAAVQNLNNGTVNVTGGTIIATKYQAINNASKLTIGIQDGNVDRNIPIIQGGTVGVNSTSNFKFFDGTIKGITIPINDETKVSEMEVDYQIAHGDETISGDSYKTAYLAEVNTINTVTFDGNGGTPSESTRPVETNKPIGTLPTATLNGYVLAGWFTLPSGGTEINSQEIITQNVTYYAHWNINYIAEVNGTKYNSLQAAINAVPKDNTQTVITIVKDFAENVKTSAQQNIVLDLQSYTISNSNNSDAVIENHGVLEVINGNISSNGGSAAIDNKGSFLRVNGTRIIATGERQAVYNYSPGTVEITGNTYLESNATGTPTTTPLERSTLQNESGGTIIVTGGTIISSTQHAISNAGTLTVGVKDGNIDTSIPLIIGKRYGINNSGTVNFYDGITKGITDAMNVTASDIENNSQVTSGTEVIDGQTYNTEYLTVLP